MSYMSPEIIEQEFDLSLYPFDEIPPDGILEKTNCSLCSVSFCVLPILLDKKTNFICNKCKLKNPIIQQIEI